MRNLTNEHAILREVTGGCIPHTNLLVVFFILIASTLSTLAQTENDQLTNFDESKLLAWANEVYLNCPEYAADAYLEIYREQCNKVQIMEVEDLSNYEYALDLSTVGLKNKCNYSLAYDNESTFEPDNFNPLKYFFDFYASEPRSYHIEGTNYIITISNK